MDCLILKKFMFALNVAGSDLGIGQRNAVENVDVNW